MFNTFLQLLIIEWIESSNHCTGKLPEGYFWACLGLVIWRSHWQIRTRPSPTTNPLEGRVQLEESIPFWEAKGNSICVPDELEQSCHRIWGFADFSHVTSDSEMETRKLLDFHRISTLMSCKNCITSENFSYSWKTNKWYNQLRAQQS